MSTRRRSTPYIVNCQFGQHRLPARTWQEYVRVGLLRAVNNRIARPARNVVAWLDGGELKLLHAYFIYTSWLSLNRISPVIEGQDYEFRLAKEYGTKAFWAGVALTGRYAAGDFLTK